MYNYVSAYFVLEGVVPKCPYCNNEVKEEDAIYNTKTKRYYHELCYNILLERKQLVDYICELFNYKKPSVKIYQQMSNYYERGVSYSDMLLALKYFYEIKKGDINKSQGGIGIIPYVLEEAKEFVTLEKIEQDKLVKKFENSTLEQKETKIIHVAEQHNNKQRKNIDINML